MLPYGIAAWLSIDALPARNRAADVQSAVQMNRRGCLRALLVCMHRFVCFLATQTAALAWALQAAVSCVHNAAPLVPDSAFFGYDWEVVASIGILVFLLTFVACLLGYQLYLAATAQTTREHSCSGHVPYLAHVPAHVHPFSRGVPGNLWDFFLESADREWELPSIEQLVMREHAQSDEHCC